MKSLKFEGSGREYFKIWIVNVLLTIVTLGFYYPWAKVRNRRYFYANSILDGRNFEYHATGKQLFIGFLVAMSLFVVYVVIQQVSPMGNLILIGALFVAIPWIIWRSMMFNMRMTSFSNVRFGFVGKLRDSYMNFFVYPALLMIGYVVLAIGVEVLMPILGVGLTSLISFIVFLTFIVFAVSFIKKKNTEYAINLSRYGQGIFQTNIQIKEFMNIMVKTIGIALLTMFITALIIGALVYATVGLETLVSIQEAANDPQMMQAQMAAIVPIIGLAYLGMILASMFIMAYYMTRQRTYVYENTTLDDAISFGSTLKAKQFAWVMMTNFLAVIATLGLAMPWAKVRVARVMLENTQVHTDAGFDQYMTQRQNEASSLGEQIGDAFDVDVGLGF
ncbi:YjgN family protein [Sulfurovum sp. XTW-4]|uniref:YjgN family protein n=1 Tax=Sulfurovum xiamenensis TaxID=3019066 RepID=A0ABT7QRF4_9BACT|nr:YjgN family protein [Sulfurovum xiamenensis]MDM5263649.1 YjgN family protein [Sulfurovum xiamenensis]